MKRRGFASVLLVSLLLMPSTDGLPHAQAQEAFPDLDRTWFSYRDSIEYLKTEGIVKGNPDGTFRPKDPINRAELLTLVFTAQGGHPPVGRRCFSDVSPDAWYAPVICAASRRGIVNGYPDGNFRPGQTVNVAEAMKMIVQTAGDDLEEGEGEHWYDPYVDAFTETEIMERDAFVPWANLTRERAADIIARWTKFRTDRTLPSLSPGCGKAPPVTPLSHVTVEGVDRSFILRVPQSYKGHDPVSLIVAFHGRTNSNAQVQAYYGIDRAMPGTMIVYPAALANGNGTFSWSGPSDRATDLRDLAFFDTLVETLARTYCINLDRIFVVGHSLGAWMANSVACLRADVVRGSATVGGNGVFVECDAPVASLLINNPKDTLSPQRDAERIRDLRLAANACTIESTPMEPRTLSCVSYAGCTPGSPVVWCPHTVDYDRGKYYPHTWPDGAEQAIASFFGRL